MSDIDIYESDTDNQLSDYEEDYIECESLNKINHNSTKVSIVDLVNKFPQYKIWLEEIYQLINSSDWMISLSENNIYEVTFMLFEKETIKANFMWTIDKEKPYPDYPPKMSWLGPRIDWKHLYPLVDFGPFKNYNWNICTSLKDIFNQVNDWIKDVKILNEDLIFTPLEKNLLDLAIITQIKLNLFNIDKLPKLGCHNPKYHNNLSNGIGYSKGKINKLDLTQYQNKQNSIKQLLIKIILIIETEELNSKTIENIIFSCLIPFINSSLKEFSYFDLDKENNYLYEVILLGYLFLQTKIEEFNNLECYYLINKIYNDCINNNNDLNLESKLETYLRKIGSEFDIFKLQEQQSVQSNRDDFLKQLKEIQLIIESEISNSTYTQQYQQVINSKLGKRLGQEWKVLQNLPLDHEAAIFVTWYNETQYPNVYKFLIIPSSDTPYAFGYFMFDMMIPSSYPEESPKITFLTTGNGQVRFNPNLYKCGKVCLSLLGTWSGEPWDPKNSNIYQVLVSILGLIFVNNPFFNEPGFSALEEKYQKRSEEYNRDIRYYTLKYAIVDNLKNLHNLYYFPKEFSKIIKLHFIEKYLSINMKVKEWISLESESSKRKNEMISNLKELEKIYNTLIKT